MPRLMHAVVGLAAMLAAPRLASAQHHHHHHDAAPHDAGGEHHHHDHPAPRPWALAASVSALAGAADLLGEPRDYQGLGVGVNAAWGRVSGHAMLAAYRVDGEGVGVGDAMVGAAVDLLPASAPFQLGLTGMAMLPTGDADAGRGMGHVMIGAGAWLRAARGRGAIAIAAQWARAHGDGAEHAAHQHGGQDGWPLVDPMNPSEVVVDAAATARLVPGRLRAGAAVTWATPVELDGEVRVIVAGLLGVEHGRCAVDVRLGAPVVGDPYVARGTIELGYRF